MTKEEFSRLSLVHVDKMIIVALERITQVFRSLLWEHAKKENLRIRQHLSTEKSHYALDTWDLEYKFPFGWKELLGIANRTDFDLQQHMKFSKKFLN